MKEQRYEKIVELVRECGQLVKNADRQHLHVDSKAGHANFVTEYDKKVQERLRAGLCAIMPDAHFIGEEGSSQMFSPVGAFFIVVPAAVALYFLCLKLLRFPECDELLDIFLRKFLKRKKS